MINIVERFKCVVAEQRGEAAQRVAAALLAAKRLREMKSGAPETPPHPPE